MEFLNDMIELLGEDLAQTQVTDRKYGGKFSYDRNRLRKQNKGAIGSGLFSSVHQDRNDPHMVNKRNDTPLGPQHMQKEDGFDFFVRQLVANKQMDNIHFPKVYSADKNTDSTGTHRSKYTMEKLEPLGNVTDKELEAIVEAHMNQSAWNTELLAGDIEVSCYSKSMRTKKIKMESLIEACEFIEDLVDISDFHLDLHEGNLMVRRTPYGLQLVINDPLGRSKNNFKK